MALVRCSCVVSWRAGVGTTAPVHVQVADPDCGYVVHRLVADRVWESWSQTS